MTMLPTKLNQISKMTISEYVDNLYSAFFTQLPENLLHYGHVRGWLEDQDETFPQTLVDKRTAARITHMFMKIELHIEDCPHVHAATELRDLYTCRVCVEHVAQMYVRGIMSADEYFEQGGQSSLEQQGQPLLFNHLKLIEFSDEKAIISKIKAIFC